MSTSRRRPTGGIRRPQVAGRPRAGQADTENDGAPERPASRPGGIAVDERGGTAGAPDAPAGPVEATPAAPVRTGGDPDADRAGAAAGSNDRAGTAVDGGRSTGTAGTDGSAATAAEAASGSGTGPGSSRRRIPLPAPPRTRAATAVLLAVTVLLTVAAAFFAVQWSTAQFGGAASNTALTDVGTTAELSAQVGEAVTKVYSFDHARLQQAEDDARAVITPGFQPEFDRIFGSVRDLAPQQQAVVTATIPKSAVASISGDRATVYVFVNQVIRRQAGGAPQEGAAAARLRVDAEFVDGRWKIAAMTPA